MKRLLNRASCWIVGGIVMALRMTCRFRPHNDPRQTIRDSGNVHVYAVLHAHQMAAVMGAERGCGAMLSRSKDGDMMEPALRMCGIVPFRGSGRAGRQGSQKGGVSALQKMIRHVQSGRPATIAVDGPKGPRGHVHGGIAMLSQKTGAAVATVILVPRRRWTLSKTWDRMQIPMPFTRIDGYFGPAMLANEGESVEAFSQRIQRQLCDLERKHDPQEAIHNETLAVPAKEPSSPSVAA